MLSQVRACHRFISVVLLLSCHFQWMLYVSVFFSMCCTFVSYLLVTLCSGPKVKEFAVRLFHLLDTGSSSVGILGSRPLSGLLSLCVRWCVCGEHGNQRTVCLHLIVYFMLSFMLF